MKKTCRQDQSHRLHDLTDAGMPNDSAPRETVSHCGHANFYSFETLVTHPFATDTVRNGLVGFCSFFILSGPCQFHFTLRRSMFP